MNRSPLGRQEAGTNLLRTQNSPSPVDSGRRDEIPPKHQHRFVSDQNPPAEPSQRGSTGGFHGPYKRPRPAADRSGWVVSRPAFHWRLHRGVGGCKPRRRPGKEHMGWGADENCRHRGEPGERREGEGGPAKFTRLDRPPDCARRQKLERALRANLRSAARPFPFYFRWVPFIPWAKNLSPSPLHHGTLPADSMQSAKGRTVTLSWSAYLRAPG